MDTVARGAGNWVEIARGRIGRAVGKQALNPIAGVWAREDNGAPNPFVCHLHGLDERTSSNSGALLRIDAGQNFG